MTRTVADVNVYEAITMAVLGRGVTHYTTPWVDGWEGDTITAALTAASIPFASSLHKIDQLDIAITGDDGGEWESAIQTVLEAL